MKPEYFVLICRALTENPMLTQRELAAASGISLGLVNGTIKKC